MFLCLYLRAGPGKENPKMSSPSRICKCSAQAFKSRVYNIHAITKTYRSNSLVRGYTSSHRNPDPRSSLARLHSLPERTHAFYQT